MATAANATTFTGAWSVDAYGGNNGLAIETSPDSHNLNFNLSGNGASTNISLFTIWTNETSLDGSDLNHKDISVHFDFSSPNIDGFVTGDTFGVNGSINEGKVTWDGPLVLNFNGGRLTITLNNDTFNEESDTRWDTNNLDPGKSDGALIKAHVVLNTAPVGGVPEPASWALMIGGFGMSGAMLRRRRTAALVA